MEAETSMYLSRWEFEPAEVTEKAKAVVEAAGMTPLTTPESAGGHLGWIEEDGCIAVNVTAVYWRKANSIHAWFVENCQGGVDECQPSHVEAEQLAHLRSICVDALKAYVDGDLDKAGQLLTPTSGFFFGSTDIDEWWAQDVQRTVTELERVITAAIALGGCRFVYQSSW
jgi:hypothetical protein